MSKELNLGKTVAELVEQYPELVEIMAEMGFKEITNPLALSTVGRIMTIPRGSAVKGIDINFVINTLKEKGFTVVGDDSQTRQSKIRSFISRLSAGEDIESVRRDFVAEFESVDAAEIMEAEQNLIKEGLPASEVQRLCDVHSALFHGKTTGEVSHAEIHAQAATISPDELYNLPDGHPLTILRRENEALDEHLTRIEDTSGSSDAAPEVMVQLIIKLNDIRAHYTKKEELIMPILYNYGVTGPSQVMWGVDDEMKDELSKLTRSLKESADSYYELKERILALTTRMREMIYKEEKILFPLALRYLSEVEWFQLYRDLPDMVESFDVKLASWKDADVWVAAEAERLASDGFLDEKIQLPTGELTIRQLAGICRLMPVDITFIDKDDMLRFFTNEGKVFTRPLSALGREVYNCHPPEIIPVVRGLIADFKAKKRDKMDVHRYINDRAISVHYRAVYDESGEYIGTVEFVLDHSEALERFSKK